jgi:hypothetical protein
MGDDILTKAGLALDNAGGGGSGNPPRPPKGPRREDAPGDRWPENAAAFLAAVRSAASFRGADLDERLSELIGRTDAVAQGHSVITGVFLERFAKLEAQLAALEAELARLKGRA